MTKQEFLAQLREGLSALPQKDAEERLTFYSEMIDDRIEEGHSESEAVAAAGTVEEIAKQAVAEIPVTTDERETVPPKRRPKTWEIVLLVLGAPLWFSLGIAVLSIILSLYISVWAVIISFWAVFGALLGSAFGAVFSGIVLAFTANVASGLLMIAVGCVCAGLSIFAFYGCKAATKGVLLLTKKLVKRGGKRYE